MSHTPARKAAERPVQPQHLDRRSEKAGADKAPQKAVKPAKLDRK